MDWSGERHGLSSTASTLPVGTSKFSILFGYKSSDERLTDDGDREDLGVAFARSHEVDSGELTQYYAVRRRQSRFVPAWSHGVTDRWTLGISMPITEQEMDVEETNLLTEADGKVRSYSSDSVRARFGIDRMIGSDRDVQIGNVRLESKYLIVDRKLSRWSTLQRVTFPSAEPSESEVLVNEVPEPRGYSVGAGLLADWMAVARANFKFSALYDVNFPDRVQLRGQRRSSLAGLERDPGDLWSVQLGAEYLLYESASLFFEFTHAHKEDDEIEGIAGEVAGSEANVAGVGLQVHRLDWLAKLQYSSVITGRNVDAADRLSLQFSVIY